jgi:prefoldin subunit 5
MKKSNPLVPVAVLLIIVAGALGIYVYRQEKARTEEDTRIAEEINPYYKRLDEINSELSQLKRDNNQELKITNVVNFMLEQPSSQFDEIAIPQLEDAGFKGIIAVSENAYPDKWGCLSASRMRELCDSGWSIALFLEQPSYLNWEGGAKKTAAELISSSAKRLETAGLPKPEAVYLKEEPTEEMISAVKDAGIHAIIFYNTETKVKGMNEFLPVTGISLNSGNNPASSADVSENASVFVISAAEGNELYSPETVHEITEKLKGPMQNGIIQTMSLENAYQYYTNAFSEYEKAVTEHQEKIKVLEEEEQEIEDKIAGFRKAEG